MSLGSCLVTNEPLGMAEKIVEMRVNGSNWTEIKQEFNISSAQARKLFTQGSGGLTDFKLSGQKLADLLKQGPEALVKQSEKAALKKVKSLDDVVQKKPPANELDLSKHKLEWPEPQAKSIKTILADNQGFTDAEFDIMKTQWSDNGKGVHWFEAHYNIDPEDFKKLTQLWKEELKAAQQSATAAIKPISKFDYTVKGNLPEDLDELKKLGNELMKKKNDDLFELQKIKSKAKKTFTESGYQDQFQAAYDEAVSNYAKYNNDVLPKLEADIKKVQNAIAEKPANVPDIPVNQPVKNKFVNDVNLQQKTGLTQSQIDQIIEMNNSGHGYLAIKGNVNVEFSQIDDVVWNNLLKKHDGFTWNAYVEKPTSESGFNAVKDKVFESRGKGLTVDEIAAKPGAPPKPVIQAIMDDKWKLPLPGAKAPIIPPPPPPPPQTFGGTFPSSGTDFRRHNDQEMLNWIRPDTELLKRDQRSAIKNYTNSGYHDINAYLRGGSVENTSGYGYNNSNVVKLVENIDATMRPIPVDITLTRNFHGVKYLPAAPEEMVGKVMWDDAFLSTSVRTDGVFSGDVQLIINAPQGTMGRYVNDISIHSNEQEMILARGTRMVVTKVEKSVNPNSYDQSFRYKLFVDVLK